MQDFLREQKIRDENRIYTPRIKNEYLRNVQQTIVEHSVNIIGSNNKGLLITIINCCSLFRCSLSLG